MAFHPNYERRPLAASMDFPHFCRRFSAAFLGLFGLWFTPRVWAQRAAQCDLAPAVIAGVAATLVGAYDIATAPGSARWHNQHLTALTPMLRVSPRSIGVGLQFALRAPSKPLRSFQPSQYLESRKSPSAALFLSLGSTVVPVSLGAALAATDGASGETAGSLMAGGILVGPSVGHWYAGRWGRGFATLGVRLALGALGLALWARSECD